MGSQKYTKKFSKWRFALERLPWRGAIGGALAALLLMDNSGRISLSRSVGVLVILAMVLLIMALIIQADQAGRKKAELEDEVASFPAEEFVQGMNEFGVETVIGGGADLFGQQAEIKLRFPGVVLQKHLADAALEGYKDGLRESGRRLGPNQLEQRRREAERTAAHWIEEMMRGQR